LSTWSFIHLVHFLKSSRLPVSVHVLRFSATEQEELRAFNELALLT